MSTNLALYFNAVVRRIYITIYLNLWGLKDIQPASEDSTIMDAPNGKIQNYRLVSQDPIKEEG